jgi:ABC-type polysaccharide/polyol phosphate export permease
MHQTEINASKLSDMNGKILDRGSFAEALADIIGALRQLPNCFYLAMIEVRLRYQRSILGPIWISLTTAIFIFGIAYFYSGIMRAGFNDYLLNLALGWVIWHFISDSVLQGAKTFTSGARVIMDTNTERFMLVLKTVLTNLIVFGNAMLVPLLVFLVVGFHWSLANLLVIPALVLIVLSAVWAAVVFGIVCARYRDLFQLLQACMRVLFFLTPIIWSPDLVASDSKRRLVTDVNPLAHYVAIWRKPLMGQYPEALSWAVTGGCTILGLAVAFVLFARYRRQLVFWV